MEIPKNALRLGIDVGSTTVKIAAIDSDSKKVLYTRYCRHNANQAETTHDLLTQMTNAFPRDLFRVAVCGSGGLPIAEALETHYIQEVVANAAAVRALHPKVRTAVELGGQDAKIIFFDDSHDNNLTVSDMRMNGSCAGGTGAFIDEIAALLNLKVEDFEAHAARGKQVYTISGRCGVFAKTDIQPLLIQGVSHDDIALSTFHAIAKQTIGGLSQGLDFTPPVLFEGGPFTFNPTLITVFKERLNLDARDIIIPAYGEIIIAIGAALAKDELFPEAGTDFYTLEQITDSLRNIKKTPPSRTVKPFFNSRAERESFTLRHTKNDLSPDISGNEILRVYIGIDSGSSTSKVALIDESENVIDLFYANNNGKSLQVVGNGLLLSHDKFKERGITLEVLGLGTTGYGELLFAKAYGADYHTVETVAHAESSVKYAPDADFILDIGGQDMKAIWMKDGAITNIVLNEACSAGCGSFLENFALSLGVNVTDIADAAFNSKNPAELGSRCTVFMNSAIVSEQRNGKQTNDILAGLCRAMIENVFTKVIRVANTAEIGKKIIVQGGTFKNEAVLRAIEEYLGNTVIRAPYPGEMGAIGAALCAKRYIKNNGYINGRSSFIGFNAIRSLEYTIKEKDYCPLCANHCARTIINFNTAIKYITGNRCERGATAPDDEHKNIYVSQKNASFDSANSLAPDMFNLRHKLLFADYNCAVISSEKDVIIGLPRVLEFWDSLPFWTVFFRALGYKVKISRPSSDKLYENGLTYVASDTICFPAKLAHGHTHDLAKQGVNRVFMPYIMHMPSENFNESHHVCPVIKGYPLVIKNYDAPEKRYGFEFDTPIFHWYSAEDKKRQVCAYATKTLRATNKEAESAFSQANKALMEFRANLVAAGTKILEKINEERGWAVVLAGRPYHTDPYICHNISNLFTKQGIPVLCADSLPDINTISLLNTRAELTNTYHARMLAAAVKAGDTPCLELAQIVSFGCGHDAILTDEIIRVMGENSGKPPLILKVDESEAVSSLRIRVQSFIESVLVRRRENTQKQFKPLPAAYNVKFHKKDKSRRTLLLPNLTPAANILMAAVLQKEGYIPKALPVGGTEQIKVGKKYIHNDICFPCQVVIGELLYELQNGAYKPDEVAVCMMKLNCECRLAQYPALLRKTLDDTGYGDVPIITNDLSDAKELHPGFKPYGFKAMTDAVWSFIMLDILEELRRKIRPYELKPGQTNNVFDYCLDNIVKAVQTGAVKQAFRNAIDAFCDIEYDRGILKPRVLVVGEILVAAHPGSNFYIEDYLEKNGMETIFPRLTDQARKEFLTPIWEKKYFKVKRPNLFYFVDKLCDLAQNSIEKIAARHPLYVKAPRPQDSYRGVSHLIPPTLNCGEGWFMAAEIVHYAALGVRSVVLLQPFGCLPNHVCGRGMTKRLKEEFPGVHFLALDFDPDTGYANVENRLQMLIMNIKQQKALQTH